ncbi:MAG: hypothetical protein M1115_11530 [Actinobacteria bacterium]|nr:hypothetical protein [Actinomycetota bacterium]
MGGNVFGYLYSVEWPVFAVLGTIAWWQLIHDDPETIRARRLQLIPHHDRIQPEDAEGSDKSGDWDCEPSFDGMAPASDEPQVQLGHAPQYPQDAPQYAQEQDEEDQALIAYNLYLAQLAKNTKPKTWRNVNV